MTAPSLAEVAAAHRTIAAFYEAQVTSAAASNATQSTQWISQRKSPAGNRRHLNEVRRLVALGSPDAKIVGRLYYLTPSALDALLGTVTAKRVGAMPLPAPDELASLRARLEGRIQ